MSVSSNVVVRFGRFEADLRSGELREGGVKVKIQELPFQALKLFLSRPNEVLSRDEIRQSLWPDGVYVDFDRGVISAINRLRDAIGDSAENPVFIETVGRRGYRWIAPAQQSEPQVTAVIDPDRAAEVAKAIAVKSPRWKLFVVVPLAAALIVSLFIYRSKHNRSGNQSSVNHVLRGDSIKASTTAALNSPSAELGAARHAANREAEDFYLQGRYYWEKRTPESLSKAVDAFTQAIVHDPNYSPAYVGLADCYNLLREYTVMPSSEAYPRALAAAKKAVELDDQSAEAHASLAFVSFFGMWDVSTADREFRRAIELDPNYAIAHHWYATYLMSLRRYPESLTEIERAQALDPASKSVLADKGEILFEAGHPQEAITLLKQVEQSDPDFISPHRDLKNIYLLTATYPLFLIEARSEAILMHNEAYLAIADATEKSYATGGAKALLESLRMQETALYERGQFSPFYLGETYAILSKKQEALQYLEIALAQHSDDMTEIESGPGFDNLHDEPAYRRLVAKMGLPPLS